MRRGSLIDDVNKYEIDDDGFPIIFQNWEIRKMMNLVRMNNHDIFYDLGCGWGQNLILAYTEFNVKKVVGIEKNEDRFQKAKERLQKWKIPKDVGLVIKGDFEDLFDGSLEGADLKEATTVFYGLSSDARFFHKLDKSLSDECRLIYYYNCIFPEIMPNYVDLPFFVSKKPFTYTSNVLDWLTKITNKKKTSLPTSKKFTEEELWDELRHNYNIGDGDDSDVKKYQKRMQNFLKKR